MPRVSRDEIINNKRQQSTAFAYLILFLHQAKFKRIFHRTQISRSIMPFKELDVSQGVLCAHVNLLIAMSSFATLFSRRDYNVLNNTEGGRNFELEKYLYCMFW